MFFILVTRLQGATQIRSSAWLEHYTDNVGVTSSNLVGSTEKVRKSASQEVGKIFFRAFGLSVFRTNHRGISSVG